MKPAADLVRAKTSLYNPDIPASKNVAALAQLGSVESRSLADDGVARSDDSESRSKLIKQAKDLIHDKDRLLFTLAVFNIGFTCFLFGRAPNMFYLWHIPKAPARAARPSPAILC